ncbi:MFS transporter [Aliagarivorans marinus]|uniref:MFS transporter n=1 Tax=Aliagarivorans marinus TaxID=561965 RepID=UPI0003F9D797|nr:MFS transporter [Aliagarivorans marinus]
MTDKKRNLFNFMIIIVLSGFVFGVDAGIISGTVKFIKAEFHLTDLQVGTVVSAPAFGAIIALLFSGTLVDKIGRKKVMLVIAFLYLVSAIASTFANSYPVLVVARMLGGMAFCCLSIASMYIGELAPSKERGKYVASNQVMMGIGFFVAYLINYACVLLLDDNSLLFSTENVWRTMFASEIPVVILWTLALFKLPESPRWLMKKGHKQEATDIIAMVTPDHEVKEVVQEIEENLLITESNVPLKTQFQALLSGRMRKILVIGVGLALVQSFSGMGAVSYYSPMIFEQVGLGENNAFLQTTLLGLISIIFALIAMRLVDKAGRRNLLLVGLLTICLSHLTIWHGFSSAEYHISEQGIAKLEGKIDTAPLGTLLNSEFKTDRDFKDAIRPLYSDSEIALSEGTLINAFIKLNPYAIVTAIFVFKAAFFFSIGPIMWVVFSEVTPNLVRSVAIPSFGLIASLAAFFVQRFFPWQLTNFGAANTFLSYAICSGLGILLVWLVLPETKNKSIEQIESLLIKKGADEEAEAAPAAVEAKQY